MESECVEKIISHITLLQFIYVLFYTEAIGYFFKFSMESADYEISS